MKRAHGTCWQYKNGQFGLAWAAELVTDNSLVCTYGQKQLKSAIAAANNMAKKLGWKMVDPWHRETDEKGIKERNKRRNIR